jgi:hypothetical protein
MRRSLLYAVGTAPDRPLRSLEKEEEELAALRAALAGRRWRGREG